MASDKTETTRYMAAAVYRDRIFRERIIEEIVEKKIQRNCAMLWG
jgi:hypothetical protein